MYQRNSFTDESDTSAKLTYSFGKCKICEDLATGIHYGIPTCEGCKGFYKRTILRTENYECSKNNNCIVTKNTRNRCKSCRFKKCIAQGMSVDSDTSNDDFLDRSEYNKWISQQREKLNICYRQQSSNFYLSLEVSDHFESSFLNNFNMSDYIKNTNLIFDSTDMIAKTSLTDANLIIFISFLKNSTLQVYKKHIKNSHLSNTIRRLAIKDYIHTEDRTKILECITGTAEDFTKWSINFIKDLPGFNSFSDEDLSLIVKKTMWNLFSLQNSVFYKDNENYNILKEIQFRRSNMIKIFGSFNTQLIFDIHKCYNNLGLTDYEIALFYIFTLTSTSDEGVQDKQTFKQLKNFYKKSLIYEFELNHRDSYFKANLYQYFELTHILEMCKSTLMKTQNSIED